MTQLSFEEATKAIAKSKRVDEDTAALLVADLYATANEAEDEHLASARLDPVVADDSLGSYHVPRTDGRRVQVDDGRSPEGAKVAERSRVAAKHDGDRYRELSRRAGFHRIGD